MKQSFPIARTRAAIILLIIVTEISFGSACARRTRDHSREAQQTAGAETSLLTNLNAASADELERLPGIGKVMAQRIVSHREQYGPFKRPEHLMMVRGISEQKFRSIRSRVTVD